MGSVRACEVARMIGDQRMSELADDLRRRCRRCGGKNQTRNIGVLIFSPTFYDQQSRRLRLGSTCIHMRMYSRRCVTLCRYMYIYIGCTADEESRMRRDLTSAFKAGHSKTRMTKVVQTYQTHRHSDSRPFSTILLLNPSPTTSNHHRMHYFHCLL